MTKVRNTNVNVISEIITTCTSHII